MEKIVIVYSSKFGHTKKYVDWLKEDFDADVFSVDGCNPTKLIAYKLIIFAGSVYSDKLAIMDFIKKNMTSIPLQKTMILAVTWYTNDSREAAHKIMEENFTEQLKNSIPLYVVNSGIDLKTVPAMDKAKLLTARLMIEKKEGRSSDDINALAIIKGYSDQTSKDNLASIKKGIEDFLNPPKPKKAPEPAAPAKKASSAASAAAPKAAPAPKPVPKVSADDDLGLSVDEAFKNLNAPKPKPKAPAKPTDSGNTGLSVDEALNSLNAAAPKPKPKAPAKPADSGNSGLSVDEALNSLNAAAPKPKPKAPAKPADSSNAGLSVDEALKSLNAAPKPAPAPKAAPKPAPAPAPKPSAEKAAPPAAPAPDVHSGEPVVRFNSSGQVVVSSVMDAINSLNHTQTQEVPAFDSQQNTLESAVPTTPQEQAPEQFADDASDQPKNSYMELFASRRRKASTEEANFAAAPKPAAAAPKPAVDAPKPAAAAPKPTVDAPKPAAPKPAAAAPKPAAEPAPTPAAAAPKPVQPAAEPVRPAAPAVDSFDLGLDGMDIAEAALSLHTTAPKSQAPIPAPSIEIDEMDSYDFIGEESASASKRALNAVKDLAKAKAAAEKEAAAKKAAAAANVRSVPAEEPEEEEPAYRPAHNAEEAASAIERMKRDIEALAEESEHSGIEYENYEQNNYEQDNYEQDNYEQNNYAQEYEQENSAAFTSDDDEDGLAAFSFADTADYYASTPVVHVEEEPEEPVSREKTELDLRKLQEEVAASIETNRANHERIQAKYGKREKEAVHNPFAVQFDEDEDDKKKGKRGKKQAAEPKRLADPIDPDIFFQKPGKDYFTTSDTMPELKIRK